MLLLAVHCKLVGDTDGRAVFFNRSLEQLSVTYVSPIRSRKRYETG